MKFEIYGDKLDLADELEEEFRKEARAVVREGADILLAEVKANLRRTSGGVSAPETTPAKQTGELLDSFSRAPVRLGRDKRSVSSGVQSTLPWAHVHGVEYGHAKPGDARGPKRVLPRPFIRPAEAAAESKIQRLFEERL